MGQLSQPKTLILREASWNTDSAHELLTFLFAKKVLKPMHKSWDSNCFWRSRGIWSRSIVQIWWRGPSYDQIRRFWWIAFSRRDWGWIIGGCNCRRRWRSRMLLGFQAQRIDGIAGWHKRGWKTSIGIFGSWRRGRGRSRIHCTGVATRRSIGVAGHGSRARTHVKLWRKLQN